MISYRLAAIGPFLNSNALRCSSSWVPASTMVVAWRTRKTRSVWKKLAVVGDFSHQLIAMIFHLLWRWTSIFNSCISWSISYDAIFCGDEHPWLLGFVVPSEYFATRFWDVLGETLKTVVSASHWTWLEMAGTDWLFDQDLHLRRSGGQRFREPREQLSAAEQCDLKLCWLMISWGIILPFIYWAYVHNPMEGSQF